MATIERAMSNAAPGALWKRLAWFVGLWASGLAAVAATAFLLRLWIG
jgi:hypothetical protein